MQCTWMIWILTRHEIDSSSFVTSGFIGRHYITHCVPRVNTYIDYNFGMLCASTMTKYICLNLTIYEYIYLANCREFIQQVRLIQFCIFCNFLIILTFKGYFISCSSDDKI